MEKIYRSLLPVEIDVIRIGDAFFVFLPGELFVEYSLEIKAKSPRKAFVVSLSNGVLAGYLVTQEAEQEGGYEASNGVFPAEAGDLMVKEAVAMIEEMVDD